MSYCVNCGVELDDTAKHCALCNTPVINPNAVVSMDAVTPFPKEKGQVETVKKKDLGILLTVIVLATSLTCGLLNWLAFPGVMWSLAIIGAGVILWVIMIPAVIYTRQPIYVSILFDGIAVIAYLYLLALMVGRDGWFWNLGIWIVVWTTLLVEIVTLCIRKLSKSLLAIALYVMTAMGLLCGGLEVMIDRFVAQRVSLSWSAVVITICAIVDITVVTLLLHRRLRNEVRRRLHF